MDIISNRRPRGEQTPDPSAPPQASNDDTPGMLGRALKLARQGFFVVPTAAPRIKKPPIKNWQKRATNDPEQVRALWAEYPESNICVFTGRFREDQALAIVDIDVRPGKNGLATLAQLADLGNELPPTRTAKTPSGGEHRFFLTGQPLNQRQPGALGPGIDIRSRGGYVIGVGSMTDAGEDTRAGEYTWTNDLPIAPAPDWLIEFCGTSKPTADTATAPVIEVDQARAEREAVAYLEALEPVYHGQRNDACAEAARHLHDIGVDPGAAVALILQHWQAFPMLGTDELERTVHSAYSSCQKPQGSEAPEAAFTQIPVAEPANDDGPTLVEPIDIFGDTDLAGEPDLPAGVLPDAIENFARDEAERIGVDVATVALPCLAVAAAALHDGFRIQPGRFNTRWTESARLWVGVVADPGLKKTPAIKAAVGPLSDLEHTWYLEYAKAAHLYDEAVRRQQQRRGKRTKPAEEKEDIFPDEPKRRRKVVMDITVEALAEVLEQNPGGVLGFYDELSAWLGGFDAYRNGGGKVSKDRSLWLRLNDGGGQTFDRVAKSRVNYVTNWSAGVVGGIQPDLMKRIAASLQDDGLIQRFVFVFGRRNKGQDRLPDGPAIARYESVIRCLATAEPNEFTETILLSEEAHVIGEQVLEIANKLRDLPETPPVMKGHLGKWDGLFPRLCLTMHAIECVDSGEPIGGIVSGETAARVRRLMLHYLLPNAARFYREFLGTAKPEGAAHARWIAGYILAKRLGQVTKRELVQARGEFRSGAAPLCAAMRELFLLGWVTPVPQRNGKPPNTWKVHPAVHTLFAKRAEFERTHREAKRRQIAEAVAVARELKRELKEAEETTHD